MEQKRVSFEVAKAIKEAGYWNPQTTIDGQYNGACYIDDGRFYPDGYICLSWNRILPAPYILDAWLWLWREKKIPIDAEYIPIGIGGWGNFVFGKRVFTNRQYQIDPEETIEAAIKYIVDNGLLK